MENCTNASDGNNQSGRNSPTKETGCQQSNKDRFNHWQNEMSVLKAMMEKLISQNQERVRQTDASATTSSFGVRTSNNGPFGYNFSTSHLEAN